MSEPVLLVADIGGTNARFALANTQTTGFRDEMTLPCERYPGIDKAIRAYFDRIGSPAPSIMCLAVAGPIINQQVQLTNNPWFIAAQDLERQMGCKKVQLINDFTAIALSLPFLADDECMTIGPNLAANSGQDLHGRYGVVGPGTGLGIAGLIKNAGQYIPITTEAGHMGFAPETPQQIELLKTLRQRWPRVSSERLLSGSGIENIYWALNHDSDLPEASLNAAEIFEQAIKQRSSMARRAVSLFFEVLGQVAGGIALAFGAESGIYIAGGMVKRYPELLADSQFRAAFESKGRHRILMERIPTRLILHPQPGLLGASYQVQQLVHNL